MSVEDFTAERKRLAAEVTQQINAVLPEGYVLNPHRKVNVSNTAGEFEVLICAVTLYPTYSRTYAAFELIYRNIRDKYSIRLAKKVSGTTRWYDFDTLEEAVMIGCTRHKLSAYKGAV